MKVVGAKVQSSVSFEDSIPGQFRGAAIGSRVGVQRPIVWTPI